jgi:hypothetical protein
MKGVCFEDTIARIGIRIAGKLKVDGNCIVTFVLADAATAGGGG